MSWTIKRNAEQEEQEGSNEEANGGNDPTLALLFFFSILVFCQDGINFSTLHFQPLMPSRSLCFQRLQQSAGG